MTIKLLDYIDVVPGVGLPLKALNHAALELSAFFMILLPCLLAFSLALWIWLCNYLESYATFVESFFDVFKSINNFPDYDQFDASHLVAAPLLLTIFVYLVGIFFKTLITVMLSRAYSQAFFEFRSSNPRQWTVERIFKVMYKKYKENKELLEVTIHAAREGGREGGRELPRPRVIDRAAPNPDPNRSNRSRRIINIHPNILDRGEIRQLGMELAPPRRL